MTYGSSKVVFSLINVSTLSIALTSVSLSVMTHNAQSSPTTGLIIAGPTASGKSAAALAAAIKFNGVIINADSMQVYREFRTLTSRPSVEDEAKVSHKLYGAFSVTESFNVGKWRKLAIVEIKKALDQSSLPIICGGTGLYLKALVDGLPPTPRIPTSVRAEIQERLIREGSESLYSELVARGDKMADRLAPGDSQRVSRALEVLVSTGKSLSVWQKMPVIGANNQFQFKTILLDPPREELYEACGKRFQEMIKEGAVDEVRAFKDLNLGSHQPASRILGVPEISAYLAGEHDLADAVARAQQATRRYAKRQMTWFRNQIIPDLHIKRKYSKSICSSIFSFIIANRLTRSS
ncbi:MAG: tRNA (adenosine(37)-N6)-dimethylallyltransferase MiaA [Rhodospirillaceae bacterium]|nr:tRNA (adenosine(37)-N6)-dimethylallyltransferase MiaA [Rhodospirillaceae bacterium]